MVVLEEEAEAEQEAYVVDQNDYKSSFLWVYIVDILLFVVMSIFLVYL